MAGWRSSQSRLVGTTLTTHNLSVMSPDPNRNRPPQPETPPPAAAHGVDPSAAAGAVRPIANCDDRRRCDADSADWQVALVGAGCGDPGLLTLRGRDALACCDVVLFDGLANADLLRHVRPSATQICVGKHGQSRIWSQNEINAEIVRHASAGLRVVRLKGGDPAVFARTGEEIQAVRSAGLRFTIVPGITAALAAGSYAGIPITHRGVASAVALVTGHEEPGKPQSALDWPALARFPGTLVIYMGVTTAKVWSESLIAGGKPADTPVAIVRRCSLADQQVIHCRLDEVADRLAPGQRIRPPVISIVGDVTRLAETMSWFDRRPLFGKRVLVTRPQSKNDTLVQRLSALGADVRHQPAIAVGALDDPTDLDQAIDQLERQDFLVFCSVHGVEFFLDRFYQQHDVRKLAGLRIAAVGRKTAQALRGHRIHADLVPNDYTGDALVDLLVDQKLSRGLVVRASRGNDAWVQRLCELGVNVSQVAAYRNEDVQDWPSSVCDDVHSGRIDWVTVTSSATARSVDRLLGHRWGKLKVAALSPVTADTLSQLGVRPDVVADPYTMDALADAIAHFETNVSAKMDAGSDQPSGESDERRN